MKPQYQKRRLNKFSASVDLKVCIFVVLISLFLAFGVIHAEARQEVIVTDERTQYTDQGCVNYSVNFPGDRHLSDLDSCKIGVYVDVTDLEDVAPNWEVWNGSSWKRMGDMSSDGWYYRNNAQKYIKSGKIQVRVCVVDEWGDNSDIRVYRTRVWFVFRYPSLSVSTGSLNFGNLYLPDTESAKTYNLNRKQGTTIANKGDANTTLSWSITNLPQDVKVSKSSGELGTNAQVNINVWLDPPKGSSADFNRTIQIVGKAKTSSRQVGTQNIGITAKLYGLPTVNHVSPAKGANGKVNVAVNASTYFGISSGNPLFPGASIRGYQWQTTAAGAQPGSSWDGPFPDTRKSFHWSSPGDYTLYCRMVDDNGVVTTYMGIPIKVWKQPTVKTKPPKPGDVDWFQDTYAGVVEKPVKLQADAELNGNEKIDQYIWLNDAGDILVKQNQGQVVTYQWNRQNLNGKIYCKAITNYGIESGKQHFKVKIYPTLEINHGGPYSGRPKKTVSLKGSVVNSSGYPGAAFQYEWILQKTNTKGKLVEVSAGKKSDGTLETTWSKDGERTAKLMVTATTSEGFTLTGSAETKVKLEAGIPVAKPGGPYRGGIAGGNYSPVQFEGNRPDFVEDEDIGKIVKWEWDSVGRQNGLTGNIYSWSGAGISGDINKVENWIDTNNKIPSVTRGFDTVDFPNTSGNLKHRDGFDTGLADYIFSRFTGFIKISSAGNYQFHVSSDDGFRLTINNKKVCEFVGSRGMGETTGSLNFSQAGFYPVRLIYFEGAGGAGLEFRWTPPGKSKEIVPKISLYMAGTNTVWNPTYEYEKARKYPVNLRVQSEAGKWSPVKTTTVTVIDGKIEGYVKAADLRTPVKDVRMTLTSSHVDKAVLSKITTRQSALQLDGSSTVTVANNTNLNHNGNYTMMAWVYLENAGNYPQVLGKSDYGSGGPTQYQIQFAGTSRKPYGYCGGNGGQGGGVNSNTALELKKWYHLASVVTFDGTNSTMKIYINGNLDVEGSQAGKTHNAKGDLTMGSGLTGKMDEAALFNRALTQAEIQAKMQSRTLSGSEAGLVGYWSFDDGRGKTATDNTLNGNHGALSGTPQWTELEMSLPTDSDGNVYAMTNGKGFYSFAHLPLGEYRIIASKEEGGDFHEFQSEVQITELTLNGPNRLGVDFVDISVFPISGRIVYSIQKQGKDVFVKDVVVKAQPVGSTSAVESLLSSKSPNATGTNYSLPLFAGKYLFKAIWEGHDIRIRESSPGYNKNSQLVTIKKAITGLDFIDHTTRNVTVYVEDSGGFPIDTYQNNKIKAQVNGDNGFVEGEVKSEGGRIFLKATVPPGKYTVSLPNVPTAIFKDDKSKKQAEIDVTGESGSVTMVVPVPIVLAVSGTPKLLDGLTDEQKAKLGISENPEGFMYYYPPAPQKFTYTITATANGNPVKDFTLFVTDDVSQITKDAATEKKFTLSMDNFEVDATNKHIVKYKVIGGLPKASVVNENDPNTYVIDPDTGKKVPKVLPKPIKFSAEKDGYEKSTTYPKEITVLGDLPVGGAQKVVSIPNVNYMVLHDPPGDKSYAYIDDTLTMKGIVGDMQLTIEDQEIPVYPSPWSTEREIKDADFGEIEKSDQNLGDKGLLGYRDSDPTLGHFAAHATLEALSGAGIVALGPVGYALQLVKTGAIAGALAGSSKIQYEVSPNRYIETPSGDELPDIMGPGKGDIYFGEGWTLGLQTKHRLGIKKQGDTWVPETKAILTYDILDRTNQYVYTIRDIENVIKDLTDTIKAITGESQAEKDQKAKLENARKTWENLLNKNLAYTWHRDYVLPNGASHTKYANNPGDAFEEFRKNNNLPEDKSGKMETMIFSAGPIYEYSRTISESSIVKYYAEVGVGTDSEFNNELETSVGAMFFGSGTKLKVSLGSTVYVSTEAYFGKEYESGQESEQTVGFILQDDDIGDNYSTRVYSDPVWGTPLFFTDAGSITSDPWDYGTNKAVDMTMELLDRKLLFGITSSVDTFANELNSKTLSDNLKGQFQQNGAVLSDKATVSVEQQGSFWQIIDGQKIYIVKKEESKLNIYLSQSGGVFDYRAGANYKVKINYTGFRHLKGAGAGGSGILFSLFTHSYRNDTGLQLRYNGQPGTYPVELQKESPSAIVAVSIHPPEGDWLNSAEKEYSAVLQLENANDYQIVRTITVKPRFADLRAPRATITAPYDGQRISPAVFTGDKKFKIEAFSDDHDVARILLQIRSKQTDGVWEPWRNLSGMVWEYGGQNQNVTVVTHSDRDPVRRVFTFNWAGSEINNLGVGEYALRAVAQDKATRLKTDGSQEAKPNADLDVPVATFRVDGSKPTVLTTVPDYQARESQRIYRGELSALFNDDMRSGDFSDRTFYVVDLLKDNEKVAGFVSYSPALRKAIFVPVVPFAPNGFFRVVIKTDTTKEDGSLEKGVHDLAGNPLDNAFTLTFRTTDAPFEETWSIALAVTDGTGIDANNIAAVAYSALDGEDEQDARAVPTLSSQLNLSFVDSNKVKFDRDIHPADGRLSHHWFFAISDPKAGSKVQIFWNPSTKMRKTTRQYQVIRLVEFDKDGNATNTKTLDPKDVGTPSPLPIGEGALQFNGSNNVVVNNHASLNHDGNYTMMAWVNLADGENWPVILVKSDFGNDGPTQYQMQFLENSRKLYGYCGGNGGKGGPVYSNTALELNRWYHLASVVTYDGTNSTMTIYINGNPDTTGSQAGKTHNATVSLGIGTGLTGKMDEVSLWKRALSQAEIQGNMNKSLSGDENGLVGYWPFDEGSGATTADKSPNNNTGTLNNGPTWIKPPRISGAMAYEYTPAQGEAVRFFRLDVQKVGFVATTFEKGSSGWKFLSVPITPQRADPFVNLGDDISDDNGNFKLYRYDTKLAGYKIYPLDIGEVALQTGHGYFTRLVKDVEVDVGGPTNGDTKTLELKDAGWHAIGNPFVKAVNVADLQVKQGDTTKSFADAVTAGWVEGTLYRWKVAKGGTDAYEAVTAGGDQKQLTPWDGNWLNTKVNDLTLVIPVPADLANYTPPLPDSFKPPMAPSNYELRIRLPRKFTNYELKKGEFDLPFELTSDFASDLTTVLGTRTKAKEGLEDFDLSEPPMLEGTVSAYFDHQDWQEEAGRYNTDYQTSLKVGETRTWELVVYSNQPDAKMQLSWEKAIAQVPSDIMLSFRRIDNAEEAAVEWQDMREVRLVDLDTKQFITKVTFEIRAERFEMAPLSDLRVIAGEEQVAIKWAATDNSFITGYTITRKTQDATQNTKYEIPNTQHEFVDTDVKEDATYTYQVSVHFKTGAELKSDLFTVTVLPVIKATRLLQSYPNPFNPETWIPYELKKEAQVTIEIYNVRGQLVRTLELGVLPRGRYISKGKSAHWNGRNEFGERTASGVYFYVMRAGDFVAIRKMVVLK